MAAASVLAGRSTESTKPRPGLGRFSATSTRGSPWLFVTPAAPPAHITNLFYINYES